jgi:ADP-ribose pyrophosphatase
MTLMSSAPLPTTLSDLKCLTPGQRWLRLWSVRWKRGEKSGDWTFASRKDPPMAATGRAEPDAVVIVPTWAEGGEKKLVVTREYRIPLAGDYYGFPAGLIEKGQTPVQAAERELGEETGLKIASIQKVSPPVFSSAGLTDESSVLVYCTVTGEPSKAGQEHAEDIDTLILGRGELMDLYHARGKFAGALLSLKLWPVLDAWLENEAPDR